MEVVRHERHRRRTALRREKGGKGPRREVKPMDDSRKDDLKELLKKSGYKFTDQRSAVLDVLIKHKDSHLSIDDIYNYVKESNPDIGIATVYRTLTLLEKVGAVVRLDLDDGFSRYELSRQDEDHRHHHLICTNCGDVSEVEDDLLDALEEQILQKDGFLVTDHRVKFYGLCRKCR